MQDGQNVPRLLKGIPTPFHLESMYNIHVSDHSKAIIVSIGTIVSVGLVNIILYSLYDPAAQLIGGPGSLTRSILRPYIDSGPLVWLIGAVFQFVIVYFISHTTFTSPPMKWVRISLLLLVWFASGYGGMLLAGQGLS